MAQPVPFQNPKGRPGFNPQFVAPATDFYDPNSGPGSNPGQSYGGQAAYPQQTPMPPPAPMMQQDQMYSPAFLGQQGGFQQPQQMGQFFQQAMGGSLNNPMAGYMMSQGATMLESKFNEFVPGAQGWFGTMKYYFTVNNSYVVTRLKMLLIPFLHKNWRRNIQAEAATSGDPTKAVRAIYDIVMYHALDYEIIETVYATPSMDVNAPDLYIPLMSFSTYILIVGYIKGTSGSFNPDVITDVSTYCLVMQCLEIGAMKLCLYLLHSNVSFLDLLSFSGYKYVPLVINTIIHLVLGSLAYYCALIYTGVATSFFMLNCLKGTVPEPSYEARKFRNYMLLGMSMAQLLLIWWNSYSSEIN